MDEPTSALAEGEVARLFAICRDLQAAGIAVSHEQEMEGVGRFARIHDPEGNPVELWQPPD